LKVRASKLPIVMLELKGFPQAVATLTLSKKYGRLADLSQFEIVNASAIYFNNGQIQNLV
jgi:hypothetical protein